MIKSIKFVRYFIDVNESDNTQSSHVTSTEGKK